MESKKKIVKKVWIDSKRFIGIGGKKMRFIDDKNTIGSTTLHLNKVGKDNVQPHFNNIMKNKKGQVGVWAYGLMMAIVIVILGLAFAPAGKQFVDDAMGNSTADFVGLNCSVPPNNFISGTCVLLDFSLFYVIGGILLIGCGIIVSRIV